MTTDSRADRPPQGRGWSPGLHHSSAVLLFQGEVTIHYNKLQADPKQGMSLDIGKRGQGSGVQGLHRLLFCLLVAVRQWSPGWPSDPSDQADPKPLGGPGVLPLQLVPGTCLWFLPA